MGKLKRKIKELDNYGAKSLIAIRTNYNDSPEIAQLDTDYVLIKILSKLGFKQTVKQYYKS